MNTGAWHAFVKYKHISYVEHATIKYSSIDILYLDFLLKASWKVGKSVSASEMHR